MLKQLDSGQSYALGQTCALIWRIQLRLAERCRAERRSVMSDPALNVVNALIPRDVLPQIGCYTQGMAEGMKR